MRVGVVVTTHSGELRPNGAELIENFIKSCKHIKHDYTIYVFDNSSEIAIKINNPNVVLTYVKDQTLRGLTGTWNDGVEMAYEDKCDVILISNDDVTINDSINIFIENITENNVIYGPTSNGILAGRQWSRSPGKGKIDLTGNIHNMLNGFFFGFTNTFVSKFTKDGKLFNENYPWGGNEEDFQKRIWNEGGRSIVIKDCWLAHRKIRGWVYFHKK